jgi:peptidyl-tRNA hydrolase
VEGGGSVSVVDTEEAARALNLVVRMEKGEEVYFNDAARAASLAVIGLLYDERAADEWAEPIALWRRGHIRKLCRRARGAAWDKTSGLAHVEVSVGSATVRAFVPTLVSEQDPALSRLQLQGTEFTPDVEALLMQPNTPVVRLNPTAMMSGPKALVACAHALQLVVEKWEIQNPEQMVGWLGSGTAFSVARVDDTLWNTLGVLAGGLGDKFCEVVVADAGFTEVAPGTVTAVGLLFDPED